MHAIKNKEGVKLSNDMFLIILYKIRLDAKSNWLGLSRKTTDIIKNNWHTHNWESL